MTASRKQIKDLIDRVPDDDPILAQVTSLLNGFEPPYVKGAKPPKLKEPRKKRWIGDKDGKRINPESLVEERDNLIDLNQQWFNYYGHQHPNHEAQMKLVLTQAKAFGLDLSEYSPEVFGIAQIREVDDIMCQTDELLKTMEARLRDTEEIGLKLIDDVKKKSWAKILGRVRRMHERCREPVPEKVKKKSVKKREVWKHTRTLRYMLWTTRTNMLDPEGRETPILIPRHLVEVALTVSMARARSVGPGSLDGVLIQIPPGHFKTWFSIADRALAHIERPYQPVSIIHNNMDNAKERYQGVREHFEEGTTICRRRAVLFPHITIDKKHSRENKLFLLQNGQQVCTHKEGNLAPRGIHSKVQGISAYEILFDDPTDEKEQHETGTRERTNSALSQTWMARLRGAHAFFVYICTAWHPDDYASQLKKQSRDGGIRIATVFISAGGPDDDFEPICEEAGYGREYLRRKYVNLGPARYACIYQNNPDTADSRRLAKLCYYDYEMWTKPEKRTKEWSDFFESAESVYWLSTDPSGASNKMSNKAGIVHSVYGKMRMQLEDGTSIDQPKLVFIGFHSISASQHALAEIIARIEKTRPEWAPQRDTLADQIVIETTGGFHATGDDLIQTHHIMPQKIIKRTPGTGTKLARLMKYAAHLENGDALFPGQWVTDDHGDRDLGIHQQWTELGNQLLRAGSTTEDNLLDCVRQQLGEVSMDIWRQKEAIDRLLNAKPQERKSQSLKARFWRQVAQRQSDVKSTGKKNLRFASMGARR